MTTLPASAVGGSGRDTALLEVPCKQSLVVRLDDTTSCDVLSASAPAVRVRAGDGADRVLAVGLDTVVRGQAGPDRLIGGAGRDRADGGKGRRDCCSAEVTRRCERP